MWNYLELLKDRGFTNIYVNANTTDLIPEPIKKRYPDLHIINTYETLVSDYLRLIRKVDYVVYGGGTLYKELYTSTGRSKYSVIIRMMGFNVLTRLFGTKLYHLNIGIGSLKTRTGRLISKIALSASTHTIFRDQKSHVIAKDILRVPPGRISTSTDGLFLSHIWEKPWNKVAFPIKTARGKRTIGVNVLSDTPDWIDREKYILVMRQFITKMCEEGNTVIFVPFQHTFNPHNDVAFSEENFGDILEKYDTCILLESIPIDQISDCLRQFDLFIGMRFHSLLLATVNQVPFIAVAYDTKCWRFIEEHDYPHAVELENLELDTLTKHYDNSIRTRQTTMKQLDRMKEQTYNEAGEALRILSL